LLDAPRHPKLLLDALSRSIFSCSRRCPLRALSVGAPGTGPEQNALENLPPVSILTEMDPKPRDDMDAAKDLAALAAQIAYLQRD
jgi:hypothetical protein